jgi:hypothetical protein
MAGGMGVNAGRILQDAAKLDVVGAGIHLNCG